VSAWDKEALPVLGVLQDPQDRNLKDGFLPVGQGAGAKALRLDMDEDVLVETIFQLSDLRYVSFGDYSGNLGFTDLRITGRGLQVLGEWPRFEAMVSPATLAEAVERFAELAPDVEQRRRFRRVADYLRRKTAGSVRTTAIAIGAQIVRNSVGLP
jgi:hypothetical protein